MHIPEGILPVSVLAAGGLAAAAGVAVGLHRLDDRSMVKVAVLSSAFFVASLIHVPIGPASVHLILNGLTGLLLGWAVFPAVTIALLLHALLFGFGGLTTLGVNTIIMGLPGLCMYYLFHGSVKRSQGTLLFAMGFAAGSLSIALGAVLLALVLLTSGEGFAGVAGTVLAAHVPVIVIEGLVTGSAVSFLRRVRPETFEVGARTAAVPRRPAA